MNLAEETNSLLPCQQIPFHLTVTNQALKCETLGGVVVKAKLIGFYSKSGRPSPTAARRGGG